MTRYPLSYGFARTHQVLLEDTDGALTLWHGPAPDAAACGEVRRAPELRSDRRGRVHGGWWRSNSRLAERV